MTVSSNQSGMTPNIRFVSGEVGSGKTTTLRALIARLEAAKANGGMPKMVSFEDTVEYVINRPKWMEPVPLDLSLLPAVVEYVDGYRPDVVVFARSSMLGVMVTNLPVYDVPASKMAMCTNGAEKLLLALSVAAGYSLEYLSESSLSRCGQEFADFFLRPLVEVEKTVIYQTPEVNVWLDNQVWWRRSVESPPGTDFC